MSVVQPVPYEPCHGRPDSQPARPRLPPGCGSRIQSSPSAGAPPPLRTPGLTHRSLQLKQCSIFRLKLKNKVSVLTSALVDGPRLLIKVIRVGFVKVEAFGGVRHRSAVLWLVWEGRTRRQYWTRQICLRAAVWIPLVR